MNSEQKIKVTMIINDKIDGTNAMVVSQKLDTTDERAIPALMGIKLYDKMVVILLSLFLGGFGVDRFYLKSYGIAVGKLVLGILSWILLFTSAFIGIAGVIISTIMMLGWSIWCFVDIFMSYKAARTKNFLAVMAVLDRYPAQQVQPQYQGQQPQYQDQPQQPQNPFGV